MLALVQHVLRLAPTVGKYAVLLLFLLNAGSWPLVWHFRVFSAVFEAHFRIRLVKLRHLFASKERPAAALEALYESRMPVGMHPFRSMWPYTSWVSLDDSDFNLHMSNSSYGKALDAARFRVALMTFPNIFRCGGWVPLAAIHYHFIREIPMLSRYEVRTTIGAWDDKWLWVISRIVKPPSRSSKSKSKAPASKSTHADPTSLGIPTLATPGTPLTNGGGSTPLLNGNGNGRADPDTVSRALLARAAADPREEDGALLYTIVVSQLCFKQGRITVPPAVVLACNGFYSGPTSEKGGKGTAGLQEPPHWAQTRALRASMKELAKFYAGGWKEVPPAERWWEHAFAASEDERRARLVPFRGGISGGLEAVRGLRA
ncbi:hypothetical protein C8R44DRAFT_625852 [Mycena epipterygia]|nr:hypothetical protein C8R44DRAFT_625852 [Mycena epipterygia]